MTLFRWLRRGSGLPQDLGARLAHWRALPSLRADTAIEQASFALIDVETAGLNPRRNALLSIGAVRLDGLRLDVGDCFEVLLQPATAPPVDNVLVHGMSPSELARGEPPERGLLALLEYVGKRPLVAFNAPFDREALRRAARRYLHTTLPNIWLDLAWLAPALAPEARLHQAPFDDWLRHFGLRTYARHRAVADALAAGELFMVLLAHARARGVPTVRALCDLAEAEARGNNIGGIGA